MARVQALCGPVELPITPMLDMTFQLLSFFVLTFQPLALTEGKLEVMLPQEREIVPIEPALLGDEPLPVVVKSARDGNDGNIGDLLVRFPEGEVLIRDLQALRGALEDRRRDFPGGIRVQIAAEGRLKYACVMDVFDSCLQAGCARVGFAAPN